MSINADNAFIMKPIPCLGKPRSAGINLGANEVFTVQGRRGTSICCVHGQVWVTQEGDRRDYILPRGLRFIAAGAGRIVINGTADHNTVDVGGAAAAGTAFLVRSALRVDWQCFAHIESEARRARAVYFAMVCGALNTRVARAWRRVSGWQAGVMKFFTHRKAI
jgi:Protein of unknown function (DUF2917)